MPSGVSAALSPTISRLCEPGFYRMETEIILLEAERSSKTVD
jgi:hypothetical protein